MKILVVCQHFYPEEFRINDICFELVKRGHDVTVLTGLPNYPTGKIYDGYKGFRNYRQNIKGVKIIRSFLIGRGKNNFTMAINYLFFAVFASIKTVFIKKDFDVIYAFQLSPVTMVWPGIVMKKLINKPLIIHCLDQWPISVTMGPIKKTGLLYKVLTKISIWTYKQADLITVASDSFVNYFKNVLKIQDKGFIFWPSYAESNYNDIPYKKNEYFDLLFAGNIGPASSVETIVNAANELKDKKQIRFHIVGDGLSRGICEDLTSKYKLTNIKFYGFHPVEKMPEFYSLADAFLITMADNEVVNQTLPAKLQSYMLAGKPIIGAINGEVKTVVKEADCGVCCDSLDYVGLSNLILDVYKDEKLLEKWGNNGKKYYEQNFNKDKCMSKLEEIFYNIVHK